MRLSLDFETRSVVDLRTAGVYVYAAHPDTDVWCMAWAIDDGNVEVWLPGQMIPAEFLWAINDGAEMRAWNAQFERTIWRNICVPRYGFPEAPLRRWRCTAAEAAAMALPRALADAATVTGVPVQKDMEGHRLMMRMARPRSKKGAKKLVWWNQPERVQRLAEYCMDDVRVEREMYKVLRRLTPKELEVYMLDQRMNDTGVMVDIPLVKAAKRITKEGVARANEVLKEVTGGAVAAVTKVADMKLWLGHTQGVVTDSIAKNIVTELLGDDTLPPEARRVLRIRQEVGKSSVAKLNSMERCVDVHGQRARGMLLYHGATTGRWTGRLIQVHNFPRGNVPHVEQYIPDILAGDYDLIDAMYPPLLVVSSLLRGMLRASPGHTFMVGDFVQIEARVLAWLAGQDDMLAVFASGGLVYHEAAANAYGLKVSDIVKGDPKYQLGKALVLGCGYQMGAETFRKNCIDMWGFDPGEELAEEAVAAYRAQNYKIVELWHMLQAAVMSAVAVPGRVYHVNGCKITKRGGYLWIVLPSGRPLAYPSPTISPRKTPWGEYRDAVTAWATNSYTRKWEKRALYGGLLTENIVQALSRDIMTDALLRVEQHGYTPLFSVHDEVVSETTDKDSLEEFTQLMSQVPKWAEKAGGLPISVDTWAGYRYRK